MSHEELGILIGRRLRLARTTAHIVMGIEEVTQEKLAELLGELEYKPGDTVTDGAVGHWEKGRQLPSVKRLMQLAQVLRVCPGWLLGACSEQDVLDQQRAITDGRPPRCAYSRPE